MTERKTKKRERKTERPQTEASERQRLERDRHETERERDGGGGSLKVTELSVNHMLFPRAACVPREAMAQQSSKGNKHVL